MYMGDIVYVHGMEIYNDIFHDIIGLYQIPNNRQWMLGSFSYDDKLQLEGQL